MVLTEEEAREKWCPNVRMAEGGDDTLEGPFNCYHPDMVIRGADPTVANCIASDCMGWRWARWAGKDKGFCGYAGQLQEAP